MDQLRALKNIKRAEVRESLYGEIIAATETVKTIPLSKIRAAAAILLCIMSVEIYSVSQINSDDYSDFSETIVPTNSNSLYYDQY